MTAVLGFLGRYWLPLAAIVLLFGAYQTGVNHERARGEANVLRQQIETIETDKRLAQQAAASASRMAATLEAEARAYQEELDDLRATLAARPDGEHHPATDADLDLVYGGAE